MQYISAFSSWEDKTSSPPELKKKWAVGFVDFIGPVIIDNQWFTIHAKNNIWSPYKIMLLHQYNDFVYMSGDCSFLTYFQDHTSVLLLLSPSLYTYIAILMRCWMQHRMPFSSYSCNDYSVLICSDGITSSHHSM